MPHVIVKMYPGKSAELKHRIADELTKALIMVTGYGADAVSVSIEDVAPAVWMDEVYDPEITRKPDTLFKKPGYGPAG